MKKNFNPKVKLEDETIGSTKNDDEKSQNISFDEIQESQTDQSVRHRKTPSTQQVSQEIKFDVAPCKVVCKQCNVEVTTFVQHEMNPIFPLIALLSLMIFGFLSFIICPFVYLISQNSVHRCSRCLQVMGVKRCFGLPEDPNSLIWHIRLGKCAIVISRLYAIMILIIFSIFAAFYVYTRPFSIHHSFFDRPNIESRIIDASWSEYLESCSGEKIIENQVHALHEFAQKYENNFVNWDGYYIDTKYKKNEYSMFDSNNFMSILVKMEPSESDNFADIVLTITQKAFKQNQEVLNKLQKGDHLYFKGKILSMGNEFKLHHLSLSEGEENEKTLIDSGHTKDLDHIEVHETKLP